MLSLHTTIVLVGATVLALLIPFAALQKCPGCGQMTLRTMRPTHRCPSRYYTMLARRWIGIVLLWTGAAIFSKFFLQW